MPKILIACEYSGIVRNAFKRVGWDAYSCDLLPTETAGQHLMCDVLSVLDRDWDMMVAHPPCTYLASSGLHWNKRIPGRDRLTEEALSFVSTLLNAPISRIALENPIGCISSRIRKPDQIIQPWQFGEDASKATCLWLKNLPTLVPTDIIEPQLACCGQRFDSDEVCPVCRGSKRPKRVWSNQTPSGQNKLGPSEDRWKDRSRTYHGIADAMAQQWGLFR